MPSFAGMINEDDLVKLVAYIKSLQRAARRKPAMSQRPLQTSVSRRE